MLENKANGNNLTLTRLTTVAPLPGHDDSGSQSVNLCTGFCVF